MEPASMNVVDGVVKIPPGSEENIRSAMNYQPRDDDVIIVTYPKCGTRWAQYIVSNILTEGNAPQDPVEYALFTPFIDMMGAEAAANPARKGPLVTHLWLKQIAFSKRAKYIYVARNPFDCCVSYYHFVKAVPPKSFDGSFDTFFKAFISGKCTYGCYFEHLLPWYELRNEANVLFLTYEQLNRDTENMIIKMADFLGPEYGSAMREDKALLQKILQVCSSENMKAVFNYGHVDVIRMLSELPPERSLKSMDVYRKRGRPTEKIRDGLGAVRKGIVGDWKSHFTPQQIAEMKAWIEEKTDGSDVMELWKDMDLP